MTSIPATPKTSRRKTGWVRSLLAATAGATALLVLAADPALAACAMVNDTIQEKVYTVVNTQVSSTSRVQTGWRTVTVPANYTYQVQVSHQEARTGYNTVTQSRQVPYTAYRTESRYVTVYRSVAHTRQVAYTVSVQHSRSVAIYGWGPPTVRVVDYGYYNCWANVGGGRRYGAYCYGALEVKWVQTWGVRGYRTEYYYTSETHYRTETYYVNEPFSYWEFTNVAYTAYRTEYYTVQVPYTYYVTVWTTETRTSTGTSTYQEPVYENVTTWTTVPQQVWDGVTYRTVEVTREVCTPDPGTGIRPA